MTTTTDQTVEDERKTRGAKLRRLRRSQGVPVAVLARRADCSAKHIYNLEYGVTRPGIELLVRICQHLGVEFNDLAIAEDHERMNA
jgi:transcriptional regulator with XRE-family HTH domain